MSTQDVINDLLSRSQTVVSDLTTYQQTLTNQPEPDVDNIESTFESMKLTATTEYTITGGIISFDSGNNALTISGANVMINNVHWDTFVERVELLETQVNALVTVPDPP